jgi:hypothetical protein
MIYKLGRTWKEAAVAYSRFYIICLEGLRIACVPTKIGMEDLPNTNLHLLLYSNQFGVKPGLSHEGKRHTF